MPDLTTLDKLFSPAIPTLNFLKLSTSTKNHLISVQDIEETNSKELLKAQEKILQN